jgi:hypothetical protein
LSTKKGTENRVADALSRHHDPPSQLLALSTCTPIWLDKVQQGYANDSYAQQMISVLSIDPTSVPNFSWQDGVLRYKNRIWLGNNGDLQQTVLKAVHSAAIGGHSRFPVTYRKMKQLFAWKGMKSDTQAFATGCLVCQQAKPNRTKYLGLLAPLPIPEGAW